MNGNQYKFTNDYFTADYVWNTLLTPLKGKPNLKFLELGTYEGRSAVWLLKNILTDSTSSIYCVDMWKNNEAFEKCIYNLNFFSWSQIAIYRKTTAEALNQFIKHKIYFDFIFIDADHSTKSVLEDFGLSLKCIKPSGIIYIDDYPTWDSVKDAINYLENPLGYHFTKQGNGAYYKCP
jgi:predicted O-methyltransferase YrrM